MHRDDLTMTGPKDELEEAQRMIRSKFEVKVQHLNRGEDRDEMAMSDRRVVVSEKSYVYERDKKQTPKVLSELSLNDK